MLVASIFLPRQRFVGLWKPSIRRHLLTSLFRAGFHLFLCSSRFFGLGLGPLFPHTHQSSIAPRVPQLPIRSLFSLWHIILTDLTNGVLLRHILDWQDVVHLLSPLFRALSISLDFLFAAVNFLVLARTTWKDDQSFTVGFQAGDVGGKGLYGEVGTAGVDADTNGWGKFAGYAGFLE